MRPSKPLPLTRAIRNGLAAATLCLALPAVAQQASFDIEAGRIEDVLPVFARQAGIQIIAPANDGRERQVRVDALKGQMPTRQALHRLLEGTGLSVAADDGRTVTLRASGPLLASRAGLVGMAPAQAAEPEPPAAVAPAAANSSQQVSTLDQVSVVGTQIKGGSASTLLPVTTLDTQQIEAIGAVSGDDLYRAIPQMGDVSFSGTNGGNSSNYARGDIASVNLRGLGVGNTLVLINGRRTVVHPTSQADDQLVPVLTYNANAIPVDNLSRVEVLLDGAAAIYGTDAVAGVVNNVLRDDVDGGSISVQRGVGEGTDQRDFRINGLVGKNSKDLRGNVSLAFSYYQTTGLNSLDQDWTGSADRRPDFVGTGFEGYSTLDNRSTTSSWGNFTTGTRVTQDGSAITSAAGAFHVQPDSNAACASDIADGLCIGTGAKATAGADRNLRSDAQTQWPLSVRPDVHRLNLFLTSKYDLDNGITFFSELGLYRSESSSLQSPVNSISSLPVTVPASNYWNPFGATYLSDGTLNPNRLSGLNVGADGVPVTISSYAFERPTRIEVTNTQLRGLVGLRGQALGFDWESALLYSSAKVRDEQDAVSMTLFQQALADGSASAYNPFCGGCNDSEALDGFYVKAKRKTETTLALWDFKVSRADLLSTWAGDIGMAAGVEVRKETQRDNRDERVDGSLTYTDSVTGIGYDSDMYGVSPNPDTYGERTVGGLFAEFSVPLVSPAMEVPLVRSLDLQIAGRAEHYDDFGSVAKPKLALGWELFDGFSLRASWAKGFRAPNLEQVNASVITRSNSRTDYIQCEADLRNGSIGSFSDCSRSASTSARRAGNPDLKPETSENFSAGAVWQPRFIPERFGRLTLSMDYYKYEQQDIIGLFGEGNALILDYAMRVQGSSNPNVVRAEPTLDDIARYEGTGLAPAGRVLYVNDQYVNLQPQTVRGVDLGFNWRSPQTRYGRFNLALNATHLIEFYRDVSPDIAVLIAARDAGVIDASTYIAGGGNLIGQDGKPEWKGSATLTWNHRGLTVGGSARYVGRFTDTGLSDADGNYWQVKAQTLGNAFVRYDFGDEGWYGGYSLKLGVNNLAGRRPPISSDTYGYVSSVYQPYPRYWYLNVTKAF
ncbi:TonB-dependent receptor [Stenotrophomonas sp. MMGLT7]|uniref:TonB-dependent receptor n=1 Tax=Stenotrophomonas sp. MMGLT7 TaxID=2901227 RepID=UPI001E65DF93|nr:TonB-dependent receptor [Stenotrophomonas sp. MMGLT7]MCD7097195.1 TonB-dependent receptor [Stenotrophomonas sp. MMGLT7]